MDNYGVDRWQASTRNTALTCYDTDVLWSLARLSEGSTATEEHVESPANRAGSVIVVTSSVKTLWTTHVGALWLGIKAKARVRAAHG